MSERRYPKAGERYIDHGDDHGKGERLYCFATENHGPGKCRAEDHEVLTDEEVASLIEAGVGR